MPPHRGTLQMHMADPNIAFTLDLSFTRRSELVKQYDFLELFNIARLRRSVPARTPVSSGRTVYVYVEPNTAPFTSIKLKGAAGIIETKGPFSDENPMRIIAPMANKRYNPHLMPFPHLYLDEYFNVGTRDESLKAGYSLTASGADREYDCMERGAKIDRCRLPLFSAKRTIKGMPEKDFLGRETGVTASLFGFDLSFLNNYIRFAAVEDAYGIGVVTGNETTKSHCNEFNGALNLFFQFFYNMGQAKSEAAFETHIARHGGNPGNYAVSSKNSRMYLTDLDSALILDEIEGNKWGAQLVRDITTDTMRVAAIFSLGLAVPSMLQHLYERKLGPFHFLFDGFFEGIASKEDIKTAADIFTQKYVSLVGSNNFFGTTRREFASELQANSHADILNEKCERMKDILHPLHTECLVLFYNLFRKSRTAAARGFTVPNLDLSEAHLRQKFADGVEIYRRALLKDKGNLDRKSSMDYAG